MTGSSRFPVRVGAAVVVAAIAHGAFAAAGGEVSARSMSGLEAAVSSDGRFALVAGVKRWRFEGVLPGPPREIESRQGSDALGRFREIAFSLDRPVRRRAAIRLYDAVPAAVFVSRFEEPGPNVAPFPSLRLPAVPWHLSFQGAFFAHSFEKLGPDAPWIFFDGDRNAFVLSAASHFVIARTRRNASGETECGIDPSIRDLPAGYEQRTILVAGSGIGKTIDEWGAALTTLSGKKRPDNDEGPELSRLGYWTDNGAAYYYRSLPGETAEETMLAVAARFREEGIPLGYVQLDSWWYPKAKDGGVLDYRTAGPPVFTDDLAGFQAKLGLPLVVHGRWIAPGSPIRERWRMSGSVVVDPGWWRALAATLAGSGVATFEQDWLNVRALPERDLHDPEDFLTNMSEGLASRGMRIQYCMAFPSDILQSTLYPNVTTCRASSDRFDPRNWSAFLHASLLARAVGLWPWSDVFRSSEPENLLLALLSGGVVGVGDALGEENPGVLRLAARSDGVLVKADVPMVPTDETLVREAKGRISPLVAATTGDFGGWKAVYVFAHASGGDEEVSFSPRELGIEGPAFVFDVARGGGAWRTGGEAYRSRIEKGRGYWIVVPAGPSGIAFLGDEGKLVPLGKKRIASVSDDGELRVRVLFGQGEKDVRLHGFARAPVRFRTESGSAGTLELDPRTGEFHLPVLPENGEARISFRAE